MKGCEHMCVCVCVCVYRERERERERENAKSFLCVRERKNLKTLNQMKQIIVFEEDKT